MASGKLTESAEHDMYITQLREVFESCDQTGSCRLDREELFLLCEKLQLEDQSEFLVNELLKDIDEVDFEEFKKSFVNILCQSYVQNQASSDEEESASEEDSDDNDEQMDKDELGTSIKREVSPKYELGEKRYGRLSLPVSTEELEELSVANEDDDAASTTRSLKHSLVVDEGSDSEGTGSESQKKRRRHEGHDSISDGDETETFEAEGQLNLMMADSEALTEEESYLRDIWRNLGVGNTGYIDIKELARVCTHIGMEEMNNMQLKQLFDKLDADGDGRVSFREFQQELFQHTPPNPVQAPPLRSRGTTPTRALSAQKKLKFPSGEDRATPSMVHGAGITGLFSELDPDKTGFATPDEITDLWEKYNVTKPADVLLALGFDLGAKVSLSELSAALEQELYNVEDQSIVYQAATATLQHEVSHLRSSLEQACWAEEKLRQDLGEANARNALLAKEVDERHANMEKASHTKLFKLLCGIKSTYIAIEQKYQEQIKTLQGDLDKERENLTQLSSKHRQGLYNEMEELRKEEAQLREHLSLAQKELGRQGDDLEQVTGQLEESQRQCQRLQRELDNTHDLHRKLAEYESKGVMSPEEQQFTQEKLQRLEMENKDLKDHNDELTVELESMKQHITPGRPDPGDGNLGIPIRKDGSIMSDYIKPIVVQKHSYSSAEYSDDEGRASSAQGRRLPPAPYEEDDIIRTLKKELAKLGIPYGKGVGSPEDKEVILELRGELAELHRELDESRQVQEIERRDIEQACRLEVTAIEERHDAEKAQLLHHIEEEKTKLAEDFQRLQQEALSELAKELQNDFAHEKDALVQKHTSEVNHHSQKHKEDREALIQRLKSEQKEALEKQKKDLQSMFDHEKFQLEEALAESEPFIKGLEEKIRQLEARLEDQSTESERELRRQKVDMEGMLTRHMQTIEDVEKQKHESEVRLKKQIQESETQHRETLIEVKGEQDALRLKVREAEQSKASLELELAQQKDELEVSFRQEKHEITQLYEARVHELEGELNEARKEVQDILAGGVGCLKGKLRKDFDALVDSVTGDRLTKERAALGKDVEARLQQEFETRNSELSHVFEREKSEIQERYENEISLLRGELDRLHGKLDTEREAMVQQYTEQKHSLEEQLAQQIREELEAEFAEQLEELREAWEEEKNGHQSRAALLEQEVGELQREVEAGNQTRRKLDELKKVNNKLLHEKRQAEKKAGEVQVAMRETKSALEGRIDELLAEKEGAITAVKTQFMESSKQSGKDKAAYEALVLEKEGLERKLASLTQELADVNNKHHNSRELQNQMENFKREYEELKSKPSDAEQNSGIVPEHAQRAIGELTRERAELQERLVDLQTRYDEVEDMAKKYTHLQKKYEDVCRERDKMSHLAKSLKENLNMASTAQQADNQDKGQLTTVLEEKKQLEQQLQKISDKLLEATTNFSISQSEHIRELQQWKEQCGNMVDLQKYTRLQIDLVDNQRSLRDLQQVLQTKEETSTHVFKHTSEKHVEEVRSLEDQKASLLRKLTSLQEILDSQIDKFKQQYEASEKRNALVVDLYKENADLMDTLYRVEEQKKDAVSRCYRLEDQCNNLRQMLKRLAKVAVT
ncbi:ninein-like protein isoform X2 [Mya arenaria]|uniref:ninein-like protein isoform X2 n=1 Tax=Mya arenaria TaxID=6604 RepID=UPI0022E68AB1|nr:ninein-like protein isoform X2 [Mya arenaria]